MTEDQFWAVIDASLAGFDPARTDGNQDDQLDRLRDALAALTPAEVAGFARWFDQKKAAAYTWELWGAAYVIGGGCGDDGFMDFRNWLISRGRAVYEAAVRDPESLLEVAAAPGIEVTEFETFGYVADEVHEDLAGEELPDSGVRAPREPAGEPWEEETEVLATRWPRLWARFGDG